MSRSVTRVAEAARALGLDVSIKTMPNTTRSAADAAEACDCEIGQIVKSLIFEGTSSGTLKLILISGRHDLDLTRAEQIFGEPLRRADPKRVRAETGFAIGGVSPIGHLTPPETWMDDALLTYPVVWAAAGAPNAVFSADPCTLAEATRARVFVNGSG
ncbi:YbaK/EbsC family protein [Palleronia caenipelagi]|uniref:YbaK/EbsC family protein n=1 Tax=Palleronia caenipelagi TaxID=2489174 RepID=A0A547PNI2_9RHOB|nr:YbaK/EbsC family protein [Palleronia caenipelagi]TRD15702.1 YbaK/EbsC family protein [Palleronia caenipelagi]